MHFLRLRESFVNRENYFVFRPAFTYWTIDVCKCVCLCMCVCVCVVCVLVCVRMYVCVYSAGRGRGVRRTPKKDRFNIEDSIYRISIGRKNTVEDLNSRSGPRCGFVTNCWRFVSLFGIFISCINQVKTNIFWISEKKRK